MIRIDGGIFEKKTSNGHLVLIGGSEDRRGPMRFVIIGSLVIIVSGVFYALATEVIVPSIVVPIEAAATAVLATALFTMVASGTPAGRSSIAQGIYGASGTVALIVASIAAGALWAQNSTWPFWFFVIGMAICVTAGLLVYYGLRSRLSPQLTTEAAGRS